jgi:hypothetical protein
VYGSGTYFARDARYSVDYSPRNARGERCMFLARVLVGASCLGSRGVSQTEASSKHASAAAGAGGCGGKAGNAGAGEAGAGKAGVGAGAGQLFDSMVDKLSNPSIYVLGAGTDDHAYPELLITFEELA